MFLNIFSKFFNRNLNIPQKLLENIRELEAVLDYRFKDKTLLVQALKHRSFVSGSGENRIESNERLEFLGDSVLNFIVGKYFYDNFADKQEGDLTKMRSVLVSGDNLSETARNLNLGKYILIGEFEEKTGGREKDSILEDCMEALIGAVFVDGGIEKAEELVMKYILDEAEETVTNKLRKNFKSELLELVQSHGYPPPTYETVNAEGPEHEKIFTVNVLINDKVAACGRSGTKKKAEQQASSKALEAIGKDRDFFKNI